ncbi:MAG: hypothetical protein Q4F13_00835 [Pseudomonadota bacterium]|nr:hypothetical protein [Pseudomonadota bacterium]
MPQRPDSIETALLLIKLLRRIPRRSQATVAELHSQPQATPIPEGWRIQATVVQTERLERWLRSFGSDVWHIRRRRLPAKP